VDDLQPTSSPPPKALPPGLYWRGRVIWCKYYVNGQPVRESTDTANIIEARRFLTCRRGAVVTQAPILPGVEKRTYAEAAEDLRRYYQTTGKRQLFEAETCLRHLDGFFRRHRLLGITPAELQKYIESRQARDRANATISRELATLSRMLHLAYENGKLLRLPVIRKLKEAKPRQGFFEREPFEAVRRRLPEDLQVAVTIAYTYGWRMQSEVLALERRQLDLEAGTLRIDPGMTKNGEGREVYLTPEVRALLVAQLDRVRALERRLGRIVPVLFPYLTGQRAGTRVVDFRKRWISACRAVGVAGRLRHDFRRTAVRNMVNRGIPERVAMKISGHNKTRAVFDRYHIVSPGDLQEAARRLAVPVDGHNPGHNHPSQQESW
jgi:integrase